MPRELQTEIASENELVQRLHQWRLSNEYGRAIAVEVIEDKTGLKVSVRTLENWEQGRTNPASGAVVLLTQFLERAKFRKGQSKNSGSGK